jgi:hypothetical protein
MRFMMKPSSSRFMMIGACPQETSKSRVRPTTSRSVHGAGTTSAAGTR